MKRNLIITTLLIALLGLCTYIIYVNVLNPQKTIDNNQNNSQDHYNDNENQSEKQENDSNSNIIPWIDEKEIEKYKNYDGTYGTIDFISFKNTYVSNNIHYIFLDLQGNIIYKVENDEKVLQNSIINKNITDILSCGDGEFNIACFYALNTAGDVYKYTFKDLSDFKIPKKEKVASNIKRIMIINVGYYENAGGSWFYTGITKEGKIIQFSSDSV